MKLKGIEKFREKTQMFSGNKIFLVPLFAFSILFLSISMMIGFESIPEALKSSGINSTLLAFTPLIGVLIICTAGFSLAYQLWLRKDRLKAKYGSLAYKHIFIVGFLGISLVLSLPVHLFIHYWSFSPSFWMDSSFKFLTIPLEEYFLTFGVVVFWIKITLSIIFTIFGLTMIIRSLLTFGFDYMTVIYLYFPEESKIQNHKIYSVLRHPTYAGALMIGLGGMFSTLTLYSIIFFIVFLIGFYIHIHFVEEKELLVRFGKPYKEYMDKVPAFFVHLDKIGVFLSFLFGKSK